MKTITRAWAPGNISCFFTIDRKKDPAQSGSTGLGITISDGVLVEVRRAQKWSIIFNGTKMHLPPVRFVRNQLTKEPLKIMVRTTLKLGCGFGVSGAASLAAAYAINELLSLKESKLTLAKLAHVAEVSCGTGLGDVANQYYGGVCLKTENSSKFKVKKLNIDEKKLFYSVFSKLDTKKVIMSKKHMEKINTSGKKAITSITKLRKINFEDIIRISDDFSKQSKLLTNKKVINQIKENKSNDVDSAMVMLGNSVYADSFFSNAKMTTISPKGAHLL